MAVAINSVLDGIQLDPKDHASINYAKARCAIERNLNNRAEKRLAKQAVIEHLGGTVIHPQIEPHQTKPLPNYVLFADKTKARY